MEALGNEFLSIYFCDKEDCVPGHSYGPAIRPHYLLHIIRSGCGTFYRGGEEYFLQKGNAFLISPMESTTYTADRKDPWFYSWIGFGGTAVDQLLARTCFADNCIFAQKLAPNDQKRLFFLLDELLNLCKTDGPHSYALLGHFLEILEYMRLPEPPASSGDNSRYLQKAIEYIHTNYSYPIKIADVAHYIGIDRTYLYRLFMEEEHISPKQYLLRLRMCTAAELLRTTDYRLTEIAYFCGFNDSAAFCHQFKDYFGQTPSQFRRQIY